MARLQRAFLSDERAVWTQTSLAVLVDAAAQSPEAADAAYFTLEGMHAAVSPRASGTACSLAIPGLSALALRLQRSFGQALAAESANHVIQAFAEQQIICAGRGGIYPMLD